MAYVSHLVLEIVIVFREDENRNSLGLSEIYVCI